MNKEQYYLLQLANIRRGGNTSHSVFITDYIGGHGCNLGPVDPPVVGLVGDDHYYAQYFQNWDEVNKFIEELQAEAIKAWGSQHHQYRQYPEDRMTIDPVTGNVGIGGVKFDTSGDLIMGFSNRTIPTKENEKMTTEQQYPLNETLPPSTITFTRNAAEKVMTISKDGVWVNPNVPVDEASAAVIEALDDHIKALVKRKPLSDTEIQKLYMEASLLDSGFVNHFARLVEKAHGIGVED